MAVVVIGCGNLYATDDAVGLLAVRRLKEGGATPRER